MGGWLRHLSALHSTLTSALGETVELQSSDGGSTVSVKAIYESTAQVTEVAGSEHVYRQHVVTLRLEDQPAWMARGVTIRITQRTPPLDLRAVEGRPDGEGLVSWTAVVP